MTLTHTQVPPGCFESNPDFEDCGCSLAQTYRGHEQEELARRFHSLLLDLDGPGSLYAVSELLTEIMEGNERKSWGFLGIETFSEIRRKASLE